MSRLRPLSLEDLCHIACGILPRRKWKRRPPAFRALLDRAWVEFPPPFAVARGCRVLPTVCICWNCRVVVGSWITFAWLCLTLWLLLMRHSCISFWLRCNLLARLMLVWLFRGNGVCTPPCTAHCTSGYGARCARVCGIMRSGAGAGRVSWLVGRVRVGCCIGYTRCAGGCVT